MKKLIKNYLKNWLFGNEIFELETKIDREELLEEISIERNYVKSMIRMAKADIRCEFNRHDWQSWSATLCGNVSEMEKMKPKHYSYRACRHCKKEMPKSRVYHELGTKKKDAKDFKKKSNENI